MALLAKLSNWLFLRLTKPVLCSSRDRRALYKYLQDYLPCYQMVYIKMYEANSVVGTRISVDYEGSISNAYYV